MKKRSLKDQLIGKILLLGVLLFSLSSHAYINPNSLLDTVSAPIADVEFNPQDFVTRFQVEVPSDCFSSPSPRLVEVNGHPNEFVLIAVMSSSNKICLQMTKIHNVSFDLRQLFLPFAEKISASSTILVRIEESGDLIEIPGSDVLGYLSRSASLTSLDGML